MGIFPQLVKFNSHLGNISKFFNRFKHIACFCYIPYSYIPAANVHIMISIKMHEYGKANNNIG